MKVFTIGFTKKSAHQFFGILRASGAARVVDVRLNNVSQLAGFTKKEDLAFFLKEICGMEYVHLPELAPTQAMLDAYNKEKGDWSAYEARFLDLMASRRIEKRIPKHLIEDGCLQCSEEKPHQCHRRLVVEYLRHHWGEVWQATWLLCDQCLSRALTDNVKLARYQRRSSRKVHPFPHSLRGSVQVLAQGLDGSAQT